MYTGNEEKRVKLFATAVAFLLLAVSSFAADISGKWKGAVEGPDGSMDLTFNFKVDGAKVSGTVSSPMGDMDITEGKIEGDALTFTVAHDDFKIVHKGKISGDEIKLKAEIGDHVMEMTLKRAAQ